MSKLLTIAIPTYKRCKYVVENVQHLLPQIEKYADQVALLVTDNHSEDGSYEALQAIAAEHPTLLMVYEQKENIGWMNNFFFGIEHSDSEFVFLLGDDDIVSPNFLDIVLPILHDNKETLGVLHFNYLKGSNTLCNESPIYTDLWDANMIVRYTDTAKFVKKHTTGPSFISSVIFRKSCMMKGKETNLRPETFDYSWFLCLLTGIVGYEQIYYKMPLAVQRLGGFYPRYCLNYVIGMYQTFKFLDPYLPGILTFWREKFAREHDYIAMNLNQIINHRDLFLPHYALFEESLPTDDLKKLLHVALHWKPFWAKKYFHLYWLSNKYLR